MTGQAHSSADDPWDDDTWDMPLPGQQVALQALQWHWGPAYQIGVDDGEWWYRRRDGKGGRETASTPDALRSMIVTDYDAHPVPRQHHTQTCDSHPAHQHAAET